MGIVHELRLAASHGNRVQTGEEGTGFRSPLPPLNHGLAGSAITAQVAGQLRRRASGGWGDFLQLHRTPLLCPSTQ
jgi:hypothetical protein